MSTYRRRLHALLTPAEHRLFVRLDTPQKVQTFLDRLPDNFGLNGDTAMSPRSVMKARMKVKKKWKAVSAKATADFFAVGTGRARAMVWTFSFNAHRLSDATEQKWASLLAQRMASPPA